MTSLVIGTGFIGDALATRLRQNGIAVTQSSRTPQRADVTVDHGAALDAILARSVPDQVVVVGQLTNPNIDWVIERVDGERWVLLSSQQVSSQFAAPGTEVALAREEFLLARGACVLRPTMVYGKGQDANVTRLIRFMLRWRLPVVPGSGEQLVQPLHVDDLAELISRHEGAPRGGLYPVGGDEALPVRELVATLADILGIHLAPLELPAPAIRLLTNVAPLFGLRRDQILRMLESKAADSTVTTAHFGWVPMPLGLRLEQAVGETYALRGALAGGRATDLA